MKKEINEKKLDTTLQKSMKKYRQFCKPPPAFKSGAGLSEVKTALALIIKAVVG